MPTYLNRQVQCIEVVTINQSSSNEYDEALEDKVSGEVLEAREECL